VDRESTLQQQLDILKGAGIEVRSLQQEIEEANPIPRGTSFDGQVLIGADFLGRDLRGCAFDGADLTAADFEAADLRGASFCGADLRNADLTGADLWGANLDGIERNANTIIVIP